MHLGPEAERALYPNNAATKSNIENRFYKILKMKDTMQKGQHDKLSKVLEISEHKRNLFRYK